MFNKLFGGKSNGSGGTGGDGGSSSSSKSEATDAAVRQRIDQIQNVLDVLEKREEVLEKQRDKMKAQAIALRKKNDNARALQKMQAMKRYDDQITTMQAQRNNLETVRMTLENAATTRLIAETTAQSHDTMRRVNNSVNADKMQDIYDGLQEEMDKHKDTVEILSTPLGEQPDEDELLGELDALMDEEEEEPVVVAPKKQKQGSKNDGLDLPSVPTAPLPKRKSKEDEEAEMLRQLEAELAGA